jgi:hypothetical protein
MSVRSLRSPPRKERSRPYLALVARGALGPTAAPTAAAPTPIGSTVTTAAAPTARRARAARMMRGAARVVVVAAAAVAVVVARVHAGLVLLGAATRAPPHHLVVLVVKLDVHVRVLEPRARSAHALRAPQRAGGGIIRVRRSRVHQEQKIMRIKDRRRNKESGANDAQATRRAAAVWGVDMNPLGMSVRAGGATTGGAPQTARFRSRAEKDDGVGASRTGALQQRLAIFPESGIHAEGSPIPFFSRPRAKAHIHTVRPDRTEAILALKASKNMSNPRLRFFTSSQF